MSTPLSSPRAGNSSPTAFSFNTPEAPKAPSESILISKAVEGETFLIYGLHDEREELMRQIRRKLRRNDKRQNFLVIDHFNNPALAYLLDPVRNESVIQEILARVPAALLTFAARHYQRFKDIHRRQKVIKESNLLAEACLSAITTAKENNVTIYFQLDGINLSRQSLQVDNKDSFTTRELRHILHLYQTKGPSAIEHIVFMEGNQLSRRNIPVLLQDHFHGDIQRPALSDITNKSVQNDTVEHKEAKQRLPMKPSKLMFLNSLSASGSDEDSDHEVVPRALAFQ